MKFFDETDLAVYQKSDDVLDLLNRSAANGDASFTSHRWLLDTLPKRLVFRHVYGDLLDGSAAIESILDVGGGYTSLTRLMIRHYDYSLLDIMAHDSHEATRDLERELGRKFWLAEDWYSFTPERDYDVVVANDLFPNVDQRLGAFLEKYLPHARQVRLSLTYYNHPRWYCVKRVDADEVFHMMAWDGAQILRCLEPFRDRIDGDLSERLTEDGRSLFPNGRLICQVNVRGDQ